VFVGRFMLMSSMTGISMGSAIAIAENDIG
jgi:hypothetical protein